MKKETSMSTDENKAIVRRFYEEIDKGNLDAMDELVAEDYISITIRRLSHSRLGGKA